MPQEVLWFGPRVSQVLHLRNELRLETDAFELVLELRILKHLALFSFLLLQMHCPLVQSLANFRSHPGGGLAVSRDFGQAWHLLVEQLVLSAVNRLALFVQQSLLERNNVRNIAVVSLVHKGVLPHRLRYFVFNRAAI